MKPRHYKTALILPAAIATGNDLRGAQLAGTVEKALAKKSGS